MSQNSSRLSLPYIEAAQAQKHLTHNAALELLDMLTQTTVISYDATTPPVSPVEGDIYALGAAPNGEWSGQAFAIAAFSNGGWIFVQPANGWRVWATSTEEFCIFLNDSWVTLSALLQNMQQLGINTTADAINRLSVSSDASLFSHEGGGHQLKVNKAATGDTASLLFQTGFSGRAEMGTAGDDEFAIKVSADGTNFTTALAFDGATGIPSGMAVQQTSTDVTPGRLMRADWGYGRGNLLGTVSQVAGVPTGAVIQSGTTANGEYVRFADGTQICSEAITLSYAGTNRIEAVWVFPVPFSGTPQSVSGSINANSFLSSATPSLEEISGVVHANTNATQAKFLQYRIAGRTNFEAADSANCRVMAIGRWF